jgi:hypothetical protein
MRESAPFCQAIVRPFLVGVVSAGSALFALHAGAQAAPPMRIAAAAGLAGYPLPDPLSADSLSVIGAAQIDGNGSVLATCRIAGPDVSFNVNDLALVSIDRYGAVRLLARTGSSPTGVDATLFSSTFYGRLGANGNVAMVGFLSGAGIDTTNNTGYWLGDRSGLSLALRAGTSPVPDVPGAAFYGFVGGYPCAMSRAGIAFNGQMQVGTGNVTIDTYQGLWGPAIGSPGFDLAARPGIVGGIGWSGGPPASLLGLSYVRFNTRSLVLADNGRMAFQATLAPLTPLVTDSNDTVIVERLANGSMSLVAREGSIVSGLPGAGGLTITSLDTSAYVSTGGLSINSGGDLAFGEIDPADPPQTGLSRLWRRAGGPGSGGLQLLAARGISFGAGSPTGLQGTFSTILAPAMNSAGTVVFAGTVNLTAGGQVSGIWAVTAGGPAQLIAKSGTSTGSLAPPNGNGTVFALDPPARGTYRINARGQVVFRWKLEDGTGSATTTNDDGLWAWDPATGLTSIVRTGDALTIGGTSTSVRSINMFLGPAGDDDGRTTDFNNLGEIAYCVQFTDTTGAILVSQLPGIGACCRGAICTQGSTDACTTAGGRFAGIGVSCTAGGGGATPGCCIADFDQSGTLTSLDVFAFLNAWFQHSPAADVDGSGTVTTVDVLLFLNAWYSGC